MLFRSVSQSRYDVHARSAVDAYLKAHLDERSIVGFKTFCERSSEFSDVFVCDGYRLCRAAKLLMSLGCGNFSTLVMYDIYAQAEAF